MSKQKKTRPAYQAKGRAQRSAASLAHLSRWEVAVCTAFVLFMTVILPRLMYLAIAPTKGWM